MEKKIGQSLNVCYSHSIRLASMPASMFFIIFNVLDGLKANNDNLYLSDEYMILFRAILMVFDNSLGLEINGYHL